MNKIIMINYINRMHRIVSLGILSLAMILLSGCAGIYLERFDGYIRPADSASMRFYIPANLKVTIERVAFGPYAMLPYLDEKEKAKYVQDVADMLTELEQQLNARFGEAVKQSGMSVGNDLVLAVDVEEAANVNYSPIAIINVRALYKNSPPTAKPWTLRLKVGLRHDPKTGEAKDADIIVQELMTSGILKSSSKN